MTHYFLNSLPSQWISYSTKYKLPELVIYSKHEHLNVTNPSEYAEFDFVITENPSSFINEGYWLQRHVTNMFDKMDFTSGPKVFLRPALFLLENTRHHHITSDVVN